MIKLCIDNTSKINEFHLYEPYLYGLLNNDKFFMINDFMQDNSDIKNFNITIENANNLLMNHIGEMYEVVILTQLTEKDNIIKKVYEIDKYISSNFVNNAIQKAKNISIVILDYTGNSYVNFSEKNYVVELKNDEFFYVEELNKCYQSFLKNKDKNAFIQDLISIKERKSLTENNEWYFEIFEKALPHFLEQGVLSYDENSAINIVDTFRKIMSYYVNKNIIDNKLILRYDMYAKLDFSTSLERSFIDFNKIFGLLSFNLESAFAVPKGAKMQGMYEVEIGLDNEKIKKMIMQYSENLKLQLQGLICNKPNVIDVEKRLIPNISLRNIFLEPVKVKRERLTLFKSGRDLQYLDRIEKSVTNIINKKLLRVKKNNVRNICDLRTLRYTEDRSDEFEKLTALEIKEKIEEKKREYQKKSVNAYKNKLNYYEILEEFLEIQKVEKEKIAMCMTKKIAFQKMAFWNCIGWLISSALLIITYPEFMDKFEKDKKILFITLGVILGVNTLVVIINALIENAKINKQIDSYLREMNKYNKKLQISSNEEIEKLTNAYELIILNSDINYYTQKRQELANNVNKYEFHISQLEKHINIAKRLCERVSVNYDEIVIADDCEYDEIIADIDIEKDVYSNDCYNLMHFLLNSKDYNVLLNCSEIVERTELKTYIKSINFTEDEVYKF